MHGMKSDEVVVVPVISTFLLQVKKVDEDRVRVVLKVYKKREYSEYRENLTRLTMT